MEQVNLIDICEGYYGEYINNDYVLVEDKIDSFDSEKGFVDRTIIIKRKKDDKKFKCTFKEYGQGNDNLLEQVAIEIPKKKKQEIDFWKTKEGKILNYGIHEHNSGLGYITNSLNLIEQLIENKQITISFDTANIENTEEMVNRSLKMIRRGKEKCKESLDYIYKEIKKLKNG